MKQALSYCILEYFRFFAKLQLAKKQPMIIGITGSGGKTSTMHAVEAVLRDSFVTTISQKANSQSGLSLHILGITPHTYSSVDWLRMMVLAPWKLLTNWSQYDVYVAEMGIDGPNKPANMEYLLSIIRPTIGVFTSVSTVHGQMFESVVAKDKSVNAEAIKQAIGQEKGKLLLSLPKNGTAVFNGDDPIIRIIGEQARAQQVSFGEKSSNSVVCINVAWGTNTTTFELRYEKQRAQIKIRGYWLPTHFGQTFGAAVAVGLALGIGLAESCQRIERHFVLPPGRATLIPAINQATILDSSYNSSPTSLADFLDLLAKLKKQTTSISRDTRLLGLLGDMRELGSLSETEHTRVAQQATNVLDAVYLVGPEMRQYALPVLEKAGIPTYWFASATAAAVQLQIDLKPHDLLLVKGSQNTILLEIAIEQLMANPKDAEKLLCRRGTFWNTERQALLERAY